MTYTKNTWANGDVITAAKLNNMEDGIATAGGLPAVTSADEGKHLVVNNEIHPTSTVIVPEQTASYDAEAGNYPLSNCVPSLFNDEGYVYAVINGTVVSGTPYENEDVYALESPDGSIAVARLGDQMDVWINNGEPPASITVSVYVGEKRVEWDKSLHPVPMAIINFGSSPVLVSGSYSAVYDAIEAYLDDSMTNPCPIVMGVLLDNWGSRNFIRPILLQCRTANGYIELLLRYELAAELYWWYEDGTIVYQD